jgi:hypothetical protein
MQAGAEVEVPAAGEDTVGLRRNAAGDVRVTLGKR